MIKLLAERAYTFKSSAEKEIARDIKEKLCYVSADYKSELLKYANEYGDIEEGYQMPDGQMIHIGSQMFRCTEAMFDPTFIGKEAKGVQELLHCAVNDCDIDLRRDLYHNIILSGGNTMFNGFEHRLSNEMKNLSPCSADIRIEAPSERRYSAWIGGSI